MIRTATLCLAVLLLVAGCRQGPAQAPATPPPAAPPASTPPAPSAAGPGANRAAIGSLQLPVPRTDDLSHVDPKHFAAALGNDPERIFTFVRDSIAFEAYRGLLRGPRGTLLAAAGNSVDRAVLLAAMLEHAGQRVRFARGTLDDRHARDLVISMWAPRAEPPGTGAAPPPEFKPILDILPAAVRRDLDLIRDRFGTLGIQFRADTVPSLDALVQEARQHYWVQWSKDGQWVDLDPSFGDARLGQQYATGDETLSVLPDSLTHQIRIRVRVEEYTGSAVSSRVLFTFEAKAPELAATDLMLVHVPENWKGPATNLQEAIGDAVSSTGRIRPVLLSSTQYQIGDPFQPPGRRGGIGSIPGLLRAPGSQAIATAEVVEMEFVDPSGTTEVVTRDIYDVVGPGRRTAGRTLSGDELQRMEISDVTARVLSIFVTPGKVDPVHLMNLSPAVSPESGNAFDLRSALNFLHLTFVVASDALTGRTALANRVDVLFYPNSPRVTILDLEVRGDSTPLRLDLRRTRTRVVAAGSNPEDAVLARIRRGVVDGTLERVFMAMWTRPASGEVRADTVFSTSSVFEAAQRQGMRFLALPAERGDLGDVADDARARLEANIAAGYVAVAPQRPPTLSGAPRYAWWRINPTSGETTAVTDEGLYAGGVENTGVRLVSRPVLGSMARIVSVEMLVEGTWVAAPRAMPHLIRVLGGLPAVLTWMRQRGIPLVYRN